MSPQLPVTNQSVIRSCYYLLVTLTASLSFHPLGQVHLALGDVHVSPGWGTHRMTLPIQVTGTWLSSEETKATTPVLLIGTVWTDQPSFRWVAGIEPQVLAVRGYQVGEELVISLSDEQLIALEGARGDGDITFILKLQATLLTPLEGVHSVAHEETTLRIPRARWMELLDQVGSEVGVLIRVPSPLTDSALEQPPTASAEDATSLSQATARLRQARAELRDGQWEHCVATCRRVLENVGRLTMLPAAKSVNSSPAEQRTQEQRWAAVFYDVKSLASAAHHDDGTTRGFVWGRADSEAILATTAGLLRRFTAPW